MFYILLTPTRTAQDPGLEDVCIFILFNFAAELISILLLLFALFLIGGKFFISKYLRIFGHEK